MPLSQKAIFLIINTLGGIAVLGSYAYGFSQYPESVGALWGDVPESLLSVYTANMFLAAGGYLLVFAYILLKLDSAARLANGGLLLERLNGLYALVLFCSALWMPLSFALLEAPNIDLWWCIRAVLFGTGIGALVIGYHIWKYASDRGVFFKVALVGYVFFCLQTAVLDAVVWAGYFPI